jgi:hypothetical protein
LSKGNALQQLLKRCPGVKFEDDDIQKLVVARFEVEAALEAADWEFLYDVFSKQPSLVATLRKTFVNPVGMFPCQGFAVLMLMFLTDLYVTDL